MERKLFPSIAEQYDIARVGKSRRARGRRAWYNVAALAGSLVVVAGLPFWSGSQRPFQARPVSGPHQFFEHDCHKCHDQPFHLIRRLSGTASFDRACRVCHHEYAPHDHVRSVYRAALGDRLAQDCHACHQEHGGDQALVQVDDTHCTHCHTDLRLPDAPWANHIPGFDQHPEFAIRRPLPKMPAGEAGQSPHAVLQVATWDAPSSSWRDRSRIRFDHAKHLERSWPAAVDEGRAGKRLDCSDCHRVADDGAMQPIRFSQHCSSCHELNVAYDVRRPVASEAENETLPLPHAPVEIVRAVIRERLIRNADRFIDDSAGDDVDAWVRRRFEEIESYLFQRHEALPKKDGAEQPAPITSQYCAKCHEITSDSGSSGHRFRVVRPAIPRRWLAYTRFDHRTHATTECTSCHYRNGSSGKPVVGNPATWHQASDVLMPSIQSCKACHGKQAGAQIGARASCVTCHTYHAIHRSARNQPDSTASGTADNLNATLSQYLSRSPR